MIRIEEASLRYMDHGKELFAVHQLSLELKEGEFLGILGPSGSGKSSLLYLLSGLKIPTSGKVHYGGVDFQALPEAERARIRIQDFGFVFQYPYLLGYLSALENVVLARPDRDRTDEARQLLTDLGLGKKMHRMPHELSGGERQRLCVARALLGQPKVIFADEPTANLDHKNGIQVVQLLNDHRKSGALVMVTHDPSMLESASRIVRLEDGEIHSN
ncbi:MAG: ATP-binding cassette domain-containing protein [Armatimonadetes bacterium]|nr:ATP-binding cassette domain-containing protein [Armatimonadota bacterium]